MKKKLFQSSILVITLFNIEGNDLLAKSKTKASESVKKQFQQSVSDLNPKNPLFKRIIELRDKKAQNVPDNTLQFGPGFFDANTFQRCNQGETGKSSPTYRYTEDPTVYGSTILPWTNPPLFSPESNDEVAIIGNDAYMTYRKKNGPTRVGIPIRLSLPGYDLPTPQYYVQGVQFSYEIGHVSGTQYDLPIIEAVHHMPHFSPWLNIYDETHGQVPPLTAFGLSLAELTAIGWYPYKDFFDFSVTPPYVACVILSIPRGVFGSQVVRLTRNFRMAPTVAASPNSNYLVQPSMPVEQYDIFIRIDEGL